MCEADAYVNSRGCETHTADATLCYVVIGGANVIKHAGRAIDEVLPQGNSFSSKLSIIAAIHLG